MQEPVFKLILNIKTSRLEPPPASVLTLCAEHLATEQWDSQDWLFATTQDGARDYYLVGGFFIRRSTGQVTSDPFGAIFEITGDKCTVVGPARESLDYEMEEISPANRAKLAVDAVARLSAVMGGRKALAAEMRRQRIERPGKNSLLEKALKSDSAISR